VIFADPGAIPSAGIVAVREYGSSSPPAGSLGLDENPSLLVPWLGLRAAVEMKARTLGVR
jgi:hypothetical protein